MNFVHKDFSSVDTLLHIGIRQVGPEEAQGVVPRQAADVALAEFKELPEHDDKILSAWLKMMNAKLDSILGMLDKTQQEFGTLPLRRVRISGGGITFADEGTFASGEVLEFKIMLPVAPPVALYLYGKPVRSEGGRVSAAFLPMDEEIRDKVVHYVFLRQREIFREQRENRRSGN